jgi:predicted glycosyl hydrolase (DUF1957 family)
MIWVNFLHLYQPPHQDPIVLKKVAKESYHWLYRLLKNNERIKCTVNFAGCLIELLAKNGLEDIIKEYKELAQRGQIELAGTAKYHPILPLLPEGEIIRQIHLNHTLCRSYFGTTYSPKVFFLPEMAYASFLAPILEKLGYEGILLDEISYQGNLLETPITTAGVIEGTNMKVLFRNRKISKSYVPESLLSVLNDSNSDKAVYITATDAEMYGHQHKDIQKAFERLLKDRRLQTMTVSQWMNQFQDVLSCQPIASSWETSSDDLRNDIPYPLWNDPNNEIHQLLWKLALFSVEMNGIYNGDGKDRWARRHLDRGLASCTWWWAASKKPDAFSPITWNPEEIEKGLENLIKSVRSLSGMPSSEKLKAEDIASKISDRIWETHWNKS